MKPIAHIHTGFPQKFGIPRQSGLVDELEATIVFTPEFAVNDAVKGLEDFSHIWLLWEFQEVGDGDAWTPTVRPPRLGGNRRMGVFATRSPYRPNNIGLSSVRLESVELTSGGPILHVRGADLRDMTPIYDIKPYLPLTDCHPEATQGFVDTEPWERLTVHDDNDLLERVEKSSRAAIAKLLEEDPRPARQRADADKVFSLTYAHYDVKFSVDGQRLTILDVAVLDD